MSCATEHRKMYTYSEMLIIKRILVSRQPNGYHYTQKYDFETNASTAVETEK